MNTAGTISAEKFTTDLYAAFSDDDSTKHHDIHIKNRERSVYARS
jgi:hypothetical protein